MLDEWAGVGLRRFVPLDELCRLSDGGDVVRARFEDLELAPRQVALGALDVAQPGVQIVFAEVHPYPRRGKVRGETHVPSDAPALMFVSVNGRVGRHSRCR